MSGFELEVKKRVRSYWIRKAWCVALGVVMAILLIKGSKLPDDIIWALSLQCRGNLSAFFTGCLFAGFLYIGWFALLIVLLFFSMSAAGKINGILLKECDPYLYEACLRKTGFHCFHPDIYKYNLAVAAYYQGDFQSAWNYFQCIRQDKMKGRMMQEYYQMKSLLYFEMGFGSQVCQIENEFRQRAQKPKQRKCFQLFCVRNNLRRACENQDYQMAYRFLQEWIGLLDNTGYLRQKIILTYWNGVVDAGAGNLVAAREKLSWVAANGNRLYLVRMAGELLRNLGDEPRSGNEK